MLLQCRTSQFCNFVILSSIAKIIVKHNLHLPKPSLKNVGAYLQTGVIVFSVIIISVLYNEVNLLKYLKLCTLLSMFISYYINTTYYSYKQICTIINLPSSNAIKIRVFILD